METGEEGNKGREWGKRRWSRGDSWRDWRARERERVGKESGIEKMR